jgi:transcriptional regulator with XRE-family HTH domain
MFIEFMLLPYSLDVGKIRDLRKVLSENIRKNRVSLHVSQEKLAESADISMSHLRDIEYCKTWVSEKTLSKIARALNMEAYELLIPENAEKKEKSGGKNRSLQQTAGLIKERKKILRKSVDESMDNLMLDIIKLSGKGAG